MRMLEPEPECSDPTRSHEGFRENFGFIIDNA